MLSGKGLIQKSTALGKNERIVGVRSVRLRLPKTPEEIKRECQKRAKENRKSMTIEECREPKLAEEARHANVVFVIENQEPPQLSN